MERTEGSGFFVLVMGSNKPTKRRSRVKRKRTSRNGAAGYDYENTYDRNIGELEEKRIKELLDQGRIKSVYATKTIKSGTQFEVEIYPEFSKGQVKAQKLKKVNKEAQKNLNDRNARKRCERLINTNFGEGDLWVTLTYDADNMPETEEEAERNIKNYVKRINYHRKKKGLGNAKYLYITEYDEEKKIRCHHHVIMDGALTMDQVEKIWKKGKRNNVRRVAPDKNGLSGLAAYLTKDPKGSKRWKGSKNLKKPEEHKSYTRITAKHVRRIVTGRLDAKNLTERLYRKYEYTSEEIRYNAVIGKFYIYVRMRERGQCGEKGKGTGRKQ